MTVVCESSVCFVCRLVMNHWPLLFRHGDEQQNKNVASFAGKESLGKSLQVQCSGRLRAAPHRVSPPAITRWHLNTVWGLKTGISGGLSLGAKSSAKPRVWEAAPLLFRLHTRSNSRSRDAGKRAHACWGSRALGPHAGMSSCVKSLNRRRLTPVSFRT